RLGGKCVLVAGLEAEYVARQIERADLPPAIGEHLVSAHRPAEHLVEIIGRFVLAVDLGGAGVRHHRAHQVERIRERMRRDSRAGSCAVPAMLGRLGWEGLGQHGCAPRLSLRCRWYERNHPWKIQILTLRIVPEVRRWPD